MSLDLVIDSAEQAEPAGELPDLAGAKRHRAGDRVAVAADVDAQLRPVQHSSNDADAQQWQMHQGLPQGPPQDFRAADLTAVSSISDHGEMSAAGGFGSATPLGALLERGNEVSAIDAACRTARQGDGRVLLVAGRAGIGKSSVLLEGQRSARADGFTVLTARASDLEREFAFGVARQLFERAARHAPHWWAGAADQARAVFDELPAATSGVFEDVSQSVLHGLYWLVVNASRGWAGAAVGRRPAVVRPFVAALSVVPESAARWAAGGRARRASHGRSSRRVMPPSPS